MAIKPEILILCFAMLIICTTSHTNDKDKKKRYINLPGFSKDELRCSNVNGREICQPARPGDPINNYNRGCNSAHRCRCC